MSAPKPVVLCILDGWGHREDREANAPVLADTPNFDRIMAESPSAFLTTHGPDVGLPTGQMGNSEVGHTNIGAGRVVAMDLGQIDLAIPKLTKTCKVYLGSHTKTETSEGLLVSFGALDEHDTDAGRRGRLRNLGSFRGEVDEATFNVHGGSLSIGHPFGATGARMVTTMANELANTGKETALLGICAAGGLGAAAVLEAV